MFLLGIDPGVVNCGVVHCKVCEETGFLSVLRCANFDLSVSCGCFHRRIPLHRCCLVHKTFLDRVMHMVQEFGDGESIDHIVCERQPPTSAGYTTEQLLLAAFPTKVVQVSTQSIWKIYGGKGLSYDLRKEKAILFANDFLHDQPEYVCEARKHDMADALCAALAYQRTLVARPPPPTRLTPAQAEDFDTFIDQFRCPLLI